MGNLFKGDFLENVFLLAKFDEDFRKILSNFPIFSEIFLSYYLTTFPLLMLNGHKLIKYLIHKINLNYLKKN